MKRPGANEEPVKAGSRLWELRVLFQSRMG